MTKEEIIAGIEQLPADERKEIFEFLRHSFNETLEQPKPRGLPVEKMFGSLRPDGPLPTDEEIRQDYLDYLESKYS
jgi:hypothetical protein